MESLLKSVEIVKAHLKNYRHEVAPFKKKRYEELCSNEEFMENNEIVLNFLMGGECYFMFEALIQDGLTKEAMELRASILDTGKIPLVVFFTFGIGCPSSVVGETQAAINAFLQMLSHGVTHNAYTYSILIKTLAKDPDFIGDAKKYLLEMVNKGMRPNVDTYKSVVEAFAREEKMEECWELMKQMKAKGIVLD